MTTQLMNRTKLLTASHRIEAGKPIYRALSTTLRSMDETARTIDFTSSTESSDRTGDVIRVAGWDLANFEKNPVFLFSHRSEDPPIGKILRSVKEGGKSPSLVQTAQFATKDVYPFADTIFKMYKGGFMNAVSVGFMPKLYQPIIAPDEDGGKFLGYEFLEQELFELSAVPVPANPEALGRILRGATVGEKFDGVKLGELFLRDAVERNVIQSEEAERMVKFICGDKNPPWAYSLSGVTFNEEQPVDANKAIEFGEWKEASSQCVKRAEKVVERVERAISSLEEFADNAATVIAIKPETIKAAVREALAENDAAMYANLSIEELSGMVVEITAIIDKRLVARIAEAEKENAASNTEPVLSSVSVEKSLADAHDLMKSAHKDMANAHRKTAQAIAHISTALDEKEEDPDEPDADDEPGAPADPNDPPEPDADDSTGTVVDPVSGPSAGRTSASADIFETLDIKPEPDIFETLGVVQPEGEKAASESVSGHNGEVPKTSRDGSVPSIKPIDPFESLMKALD